MEAPTEPPIGPVSSSVADWGPGGAVGRYALVAKIAVGGMAEIWLARQAGPKGFEKAVVIKKVSDAYTHDPEFIEMFLDEARIAAQLNHPNIVQIYDLGEDRGAYYIAMEYLPGENLAAVMRAAKQGGRSLPLAFAARLIATTADALGHAHQKIGLDGKPLHVVHRDVSPQNLILTYDGVLKVVDFGIAKAANRSTHTQGNQFKGKISYLSPEQARGRPVDARTDIFGMGIVLFELVTRSRLFAFEDPVQGIQAIGGTAPLPRARDRNPEIPPELDAIIVKALTRDPDQRYQTARELQLDLEAWLRSWPEPSGSAELSAYMHGLFADRIAQRVKLLEQALRGDLGASVAPSMVTPSSHKSMPGATRSERPPGRSTRAGSVMALSLAAFALAGGTAYAVHRWSAPEPAPAAALAPAPVAAPRLSIDTDPPGARVSVDGVAQGTAPLTLDQLSPGVHALTADMPAHQQAQRRVQLEAGKAESVRLVLVPETPAEPARPVGASAEPKARKAQARKGRLTLDTSPWTRVFLGGKDLGDTPLIDVSVPSGTLILNLVNESKGIHRSIEVEIEPGQSTTKKLKL